MKYEEYFVFELPAGVELVRVVAECCDGSGALSASSIRHIQKGVYWIMFKVSRLRVSSASSMKHKEPRLEDDVQRRRYSANA